MFPLTSQGVTVGFAVGIGIVNAECLFIFICLNLVSVSISFCFADSFSLVKPGFLVTEKEVNIMIMVSQNVMPSKKHL